MALDTLAALHASLGLPAPDPDEIEIEGADPILPTQFRVGDAAAAALGGRAARTHPGRARGARARRDRRRLASLLSFLYQKIESGGAMGPGRAQPDRLLRRGRRLVPVPPGFPTPTPGAALLGCAAGATRWPGRSRPDAQARDARRARLCGARDAPDAVGGHRGFCLAAVPVVEVIGATRHRPLAPGAPLEACALDLTRACSPVHLRPRPPRTRRGAAASARPLPFVTVRHGTSHGKRSAHPHLRDSGDAERLSALVRHADVFTQGYRSGALERLGFGVEALHALRPGLIYVSINCYGHDGPWAGRPGWEQLAQTVTGIAAEQGGAAGPKLLPAAATDYNTGYLAALGVMLALERRAREGGSYEVRASLSRTGMWLDSLARADRPGPGLTPERVAPFMTRSETPFGRLAHLGPIVDMSATPARWARPTCPLGTHPPEW
jgi:hypothetical protein